MGMVPPRLILPRRKETQLKEEHPCAAEWDAIREQGLLHNDGSFAFPPDSGSVLAPQVDEQLIGKEYR